MNDEDKIVEALLELSEDESEKDFGKIAALLLGSLIPPIILAFIPGMRIEIMGFISFLIPPLIFLKLKLEEMYGYAGLAFGFVGFVIGVYLLPVSVFGDLILPLDIPTKLRLIELGVDPVRLFLRVILRVVPFSSLMLGLMTGIILVRFSALRKAEVE